MTNFLDRAYEGSATTGTGTFTLNGVAVSKYRTWSAAGAVDGRPYEYIAIEGTAWEVGYGTYTASGTTLTRNLIASSTGSKINFGGTQNIAQSLSTRSLNGLYYPPLTPLVNGDYSWVNQGGASITENANGGLYLKAPNNSGINLRMREKALPAAPYRIEIAVIPCLVNLAWSAVGMYVRDSVGGKIVTANCLRSNVFGDTKVIADKFNNFTTHSGGSYTSYSLYGVGLVFFHISDDNAGTRTIGFSMDGYNFESLGSHSSTDFVTPTHCGIFADEENASGFAAGTFVHWKES